MLAVQSMTDLVIEPVLEPVLEQLLEKDARTGSGAALHLTHTRLLDAVQTQPNKNAWETALLILNDLMQFRRMNEDHICEESSCLSCVEPHLPKVISAVGFPRIVPGDFLIVYHLSTDAVGGYWSAISTGTHWVSRAG